MSLQHRKLFLIQFTKYSSFNNIIIMYSLFNEGDVINTMSYLTYGLSQPDGIDCEPILWRKETVVPGENP